MPRRKWRRHASYGLVFGSTVAAFLAVLSFLDASGIESPHLDWAAQALSALLIVGMASIGGASYSAFRAGSTSRARFGRALAGARAGVVAGGSVGVLMVGGRFLAHGTIGLGVMLGMMTYGAVGGASFAAVDW